MAKLYNLARMTVASTGTGTITLGSAVSGCLSFADAGAINGDTVSYGIDDGAAAEVGRGVYTSSDTTLTRVPIVSTNSGSAIDMTSDAEVFITCLAEDFTTVIATDTLWDAKGDLAVGTGANTAEKLTVGTDGQVLMASSTDTTGTKWGDITGFSTGDIHEVELYRSTLSTDGNFDFSSIPATYDHLKIRLIARGNVNAAQDNLYIYFNNDTTAGNYFHQRHSAYDGNTSGSNEGDTPLIGEVPAATASANCFGWIEIFIPLYAVETFNKVAKTSSGYRSAASLAVVQHDFVEWEFVTAINRITLQPDGYASDKLVANSFCQVIGIKTEA